MTKKEFLKGMDQVFYEVENGYHSCNELEEFISWKARSYYNLEFRLNNSSHWLWVYLEELDSFEREERIMLRQFLLSWFKEWSLDNKLYLEY